MERLNEVKAIIHSMTEEDYVKFMREVHISYPTRSSELTNKITNSWKNVQKKKVKSGMGKVSAVNDCNTPSTSGHGSNLVSSVSSPISGQNTPSSSGQGSKLVSSVSTSVPTGDSTLDTSGQARKLESSVPLPWQKSAWKTGFIFRGDKVPINGNLFIDVEKVTLKKTRERRKHKQVAATICIVNEDGKVVLRAFIHIPNDEICQYAPKVTNLDERKLGAGVDLHMVHKCLDMCLKGNQLIGIALENDLASLSYNFKNCFDLHSVYRDEKGGFALAHIVKKLLNNRSGFQAGHHSAIDDARRTLAAYHQYKKASASGTLTSDLLKLSASRNEYKASKPKLYAEKCNCEKM